MSLPREPRLAGAPRVELLDLDVIPGAGEEAGVVYLHGWGFDKAQMRTLAAAIGQAAGLAVLPSLRGHGASPAPAWGYSAWEAAADLQRLADALPPRVDLVGFSWGGLVALAGAVALGPDRVRRVVVVDCALGPEPERLREGNGLEPTFLKYAFDHRHVLRAVVDLGIATTVVVGRDSGVVPDPERAALAAEVRPGLTVREAPGDHLELVERADPLATIVAEALA